MIPTQKHLSVHKSQLTALTNHHKESKLKALVQASAKQMAVQHHGKMKWIVYGTSEGKNCSQQHLNIPHVVRRAPAM
jgi:hypothetical protein